ncbi:MAG: response regulator [Gammaproteobacteria bacterium]|nr:response regulator [Gammaproteobacteria bacterium]
MNRLGIKYQILVITFIPAFLIDVFFTYSHITTSISQAQELLQAKGQIISKQIAGASEFNLFSGNDKQIQYMLDQTIDTHDIILAAAYNLEGDLIAESMSDIYSANESIDYFYFHQAILSESIAVSDVFSPDQIDGSLNQTIGWVHLYISRQQLDETKANVIRDSIIFFVIVLIMTLVLTTIISRGITSPIFKLMNHLGRVETGYLGELIEPVEENEIGAVQRGFNRMTQSLSINRKHLNDRIQQATQQLSEAITDLEAKNRELGFARDEAQNANRIKSEFLANMSHEIRTPINGIKGFISLMGQSDLTPQQKRYADIILKSTNDLTSIINEILDFSKLESGKLQIIEDDFNLYEIIEQTRDILFINVISKNIDLILIIYSDTPKLVCGDKLRLKQILLNLMGNAIKFTDQGQVVVRVALEQASNNEVEILITVEDTGIGIADQDQEYLFTAFSQVESAANRRYSGTGLGLVICKNLVNLMGGEITMQSTYGEGSTFSIHLPFSIPLNIKPEDPTPALDLTTFIFASQKTCLQETQSLFDRTGVATEGLLIDATQSTDQIREIIQKNLKFIDIIVFDLRHMTQNLDDIIYDQFIANHRVLVMHYDQSLIPDLKLSDYEFVSNITTSSNLTKLLESIPQSNYPQQSIETKQVLPQQSKKVLLVDDNQINLKLAAELVRLWGHHATEASHARAAMALYQQQNFDLIILDIQMPEIDGTTLLKMMREEKSGNKTPFVALTANIMPEEAERLLNLGFDYYLSKPIDEEKFKSILDGSYSIDKSEKSIPIEGDNLDLNNLRSVDVEKSLILSANNHSLLIQIFELLLREVPTHQKQLEEAMEISDQKKISMILHKIHGITCYASLPKLRQLVLAAQHHSPGSSIESFDDGIRAIIAELYVIKIETETLIAEYSELVD